jgi:hypothetical protein
VYAVSIGRLTIRHESLAFRHICKSVYDASKHIERERKGRKRTKRSKKKDEEEGQDNPRRGMRKRRTYTPAAAERASSPTHIPEH